MSYVYLTAVQKGVTNRGLQGEDGHSNVPLNDGIVHHYMVSQHTAETWTFIPVKTSSLSRSNKLFHRKNYITLSLPLPTQEVSITNISGRKLRSEFQYMEH